MQHFRFSLKENAIPAQNVCGNDIYDSESEKALKEVIAMLSSEGLT